MLCPFEEEKYSHGKLTGWGNHAANNKWIIYYVFGNITLMNTETLHDIKYSGPEQPRLSMPVL